MNIEVTNVTITRLKSSTGNLMAYADITLNKSLVVKGLRLINGQKGLFVAFPSTKGKDDKYYDIVFPIDRETREHISEAVVEEYNKDTSTTRKSKKPAAETEKPKEATDDFFNKK